MADVAESVTSLEGLFKQQYPTGLPDLIPNGTKLQKEIDFVAKDLELGDSYVQPVRLSYPMGFTHAASGAGAFSLQDSVPGQLRKATVDGYQILLRDQVDMESAAKASNGSKKAFEDIVSINFGGLKKSMRKRIEVELFYGQSGVGAISSIAGSSTTRTWTISNASWASGIWSGVEGCKLDVYNGVTQRNTNATVTVTSVDIDNKTVSVSGNSSDLTASLVGDSLYFRGAFSSEMAGLKKILSTTSGNLFNISTTTYSLWRGTAQALTGAMSFNASKKGVAKAVGKGLDEGCDLYVSPGGWDDMLTDVAALRRTDKSEVGKVVIGAEEIEFHSQAGKIRVIPSIYVAEGDAFGLAQGDYWKRVGASDVTFNMPGFGDQIFFTLPTAAGIETRCYTNQSLFCDAIGKNIYFSGIVNSTAV